jgi:hypothetical protein
MYNDIKYNDVKNCKWGNKEHTIILCDVDFEHLDQIYVPFSADENDKYNHTKEIFAKAIAGEFGIIAEYEEPLPPTKEQLAQQARWQRDSLLQEVDRIVSNPLRWASFSQAQQTAWANYRQALLDVPQQDGFPNSVDFPVKPIL